MPMSPEKLRRFADAEEKSSTAVGSIGINAVLNKYYQQMDFKKLTSDDECVAASHAQDTRLVSTNQK